jgi:methyl-accepting chemotaxis protein
MGAFALFHSVRSFQAAVEQQGRSLVGALRQRKAIGSANTNVLRYLLTRDEKFITARDADMPRARQALAELRDSSPTAELRTGWAEVLATLDNWDEAAKADIAAEKAGRHEEALRIRSERVGPIREKLTELADRLVDGEEAYAAGVTRQADARSKRWLLAMMIVAGLTMAAGTLVAVALTRAITGLLRETVGSLSSSATEILAATTQQASGAAQEAAAVQQTTTTVDQVKQTAQLSSLKAGAVAEAAQRSVQVSQEGRRAVEETIKGMQDSKLQTEAIADRILALSERAQAIADVIVTVNDMAEQSNLLAVNAGIEAAKAGEAGKGFAVVAGEVKALAHQSKQATARVREILSEIQRATQSAVMAAEKGVKASESGLTLAAHSGEAFQVLADSLAESAQAAQQILSSTRQQVTGTDQIALAMRSIQQASTQNMASTRQVERAAQDLNELTGRLRRLVTRAEALPRAAAAANGV